MRVSVIVFPGTNCDHDMAYTYSAMLGQKVEMVWHRDSDLKKPDLVVIPGGFSYGDYLRTGALAKLSPVMEAVREYAAAGGLVLGICNGFQILCESGLLPGVLMQNRSRKFLSKFLNIRVENNSTNFTSKYAKSETLFCPVAHFDGNYFADPETIKKVEDQGQVIFRYCSSTGEVDAESESINPNGSINSIAGLCNDKFNVLGMMPHPERAIQDKVMANSLASGIKLFESVLA